jgi:hypothetical protein
MVPLIRTSWANLQDAYGSAADIPDLLRAIATDPRVSSSSVGPWFDLWSALCHQHDVYPASFAAVPHIVQILADHVDSACADFFLLPASIELARYRRGVPLPADLADDYLQALARFPAFVAAAAVGPWDATRARSILAAVAVAKAQHDTAELLLEIDDVDTGEVLQWYLSR